MRVSLVNTRGRHTQSPGIPLGIAYLGGILRQDGHKVQLIDPLTEFQDRIVSQISAFKPDLVGISTMTLNFRMAMEMVRPLRSSLPPKTIFCAGGLHPTAMPEDSLRKLEVDFIVAGEGELALSSVCKALEKRRSLTSIKKIPSVGWLDAKGRFILNPGKVVENLDFLPFPAFDLLDMELYLRPPGFIRGMIFNRVASLMFSRGCPFRCTYCSSSVMFKRKYRTHSVSYMLKLLKLLKKRYNIDAYYFTDETLTLQKERILDLCQGLKSFQIPWGCSTRADLLDWELLKAMADSGCAHIDFGVESGSQKIRDLLHRGQSEAVFERVFSMCKKLKIRQFAQVMVGCPQESWSDVNLTVKLLKKLKPTYTMVSVFTPLPGTEAFEQAKRAQRLGSVSRYIEQLYDFDIANAEYPLANVSKMTKKQILEARSKILRSVFWDNYTSMLTLAHFKFLLRSVWASFFNIPRTFKALGKAIKEKRVEYLVFALIFNYVSKYHPKNVSSKS